MYTHCDYNSDWLSQVYMYKEDKISLLLILHLHCKNRLIDLTNILLYRLHVAKLVRCKVNITLFLLLMYYSYINSSLVNLTNIVYWLN